MLLSGKVYDCSPDALSAVVRSCPQYFLQICLKDGQVELVLTRIIMIALKVFISFCLTGYILKIMVTGYSTLLNLLKSN